MQQLNTQERPTSVTTETIRAQPAHNGAIRRKPEQSEIPDTSSIKLWATGLGQATAPTWHRTAPTWHRAAPTWHRATAPTWHRATASTWHWATALAWRQVTALACFSSIIDLGQTPQLCYSGYIYIRRGNTFIGYQFRLCLKKQSHPLPSDLSSLVDYEPQEERADFTSMVAPSSYANHS